MAINSAFQIRGKTFSLSAGAVNQSAVVLLSDLGIDQYPQAWRFVNNGTLDVWIDIADAAAGAAFPLAGTVTSGTPTYGFRLKPGIIEVLGDVIRKTLALPPSPPQFFVNYVSTAAGPTPFDIVPGEGL